MIEGETLRFDLPLADVQRVIPQLNNLGVGCKRVLEWTETGPQGPHSVVPVACVRTPAGQVRGQVETNSTLSKFGF